MARRTEMARIGVASEGRSQAATAQQAERMSVRAYCEQAGLRDAKRSSRADYFSTNDRSITESPGVPMCGGISKPRFLRLMSRSANRLGLPQISPRGVFRI